MAHLLQGLIDWTTSEPWSDRFDVVLEQHLLPTCDETGLEYEDIVSILGDDLFMSTVWACAFEDLLTREFEDGSSIVDAYLKRHGKETESDRAYIRALQNSVVSLYEVSDVVLDTSFRARDLLRGGEPVLISERLATRSLKQWDRFAGRVLQVGQKMQISGALLHYEHETSENLVEAIRGLGKLTRKKKKKFVEAIGEDFDAAAITRLSEDDRLHALSPMFTTCWLLDAIEKAETPVMPDLRNADGDEILACTVTYPFSDGAATAEIRRSLDKCSDLRRTNPTHWEWVRRQKRRSASAARAMPPQALTVETWQEDGNLVLGGVKLDGRTVVLSVNSLQRSERGIDLISSILGKQVGPPLIMTESVDQILASRHANKPPPLDISEQEQSTIVHATMDRHYRETLDQPVPSLGNKSPRAAVQTASGRAKVADWLKFLENQTARSGRSNKAMASYSFDWMWTELGVAKLRR